jgi:hypothetical protein
MWLISNIYFYWIFSHYYFIYKLVINHLFCNNVVVHDILYLLGGFCFVSLDVDCLSNFCVWSCVCAFSCVCAVASAGVPFGADGAGAGF